MCCHFKQSFPVYLSIVYLLFITEMVRIFHSMIQMIKNVTYSRKHKVF